MRRLLVGMLLWGLACGPRGSEAPAEPPAEPPVSPTPPVEPEPEPVPTVVPDPEPEPEPAPEPEPEPPAEIVKPWPPQWEPRILAVQPIVAEAAAEYGVDPHLVNGVIWVESKFDRKARNRSGARGLMQLMPKTAKSLGRALKRPARVYDAEFNVHAGTYYLSRLMKKFDGDESLALASYVRGPTKVRSWVDGDQPFPDGVKGFVDKVQRAREVFAGLGWPEPPPAEASPADASTEEISSPEAAPANAG